MIQCNKCDEWYHTQCLGLNFEDAQAIEEYACFRCGGEQSAGAAAVEGKSILPCGLAWRPLRNCLGQEPCSRVRCHGKCMYATCLDVERRDTSGLRSSASFESHQSSPRPNVPGIQVAAAFRLITALTRYHYAY
ncbi:hypothetical protein K437DRAFT_256822 [Tilletiaria anomala UBC 951]|uniref:PHD-type domain-containing protein n=1 Tax=Tilletiaria anomala (strain ATCC 24038 / CBS 436.72 / UBC 951) TaxID=1037660 RepID=A0A066VU12_TILAU|nr:uncharacterized protein K437DRAFT_256822 [Tilletiaria anomala UBC 951]KDN44956.1 hypothetical protein K437DRAFT_256822 [Tilletiaria anomala UBC 951]